MAESSKAEQSVSHLTWCTRYKTPWFVSSRTEMVDSLCCRQTERSMSSHVRPSASKCVVQCFQHFTILCTSFQAFASSALQSLQTILLSTLRFCLSSNEVLELDVMSHKSASNGVSPVFAVGSLLCAQVYRPTLLFFSETDRISLDHDSPMANDEAAMIAEAPSIGSIK